MKLRWPGWIVIVVCGAIPGGALGQDAGEGKILYMSYCSTCHGEQGKGDGVAARSLPVKPADHTNGAVMDQLSDSYLTEIITKGGSAVKKSGFMPAWGSSLTPKQVADLVGYVRSLSSTGGKGGAK
jgi:mono/diheme cytochrome c family protein